MTGQVHGKEDLLNLDEAPYIDLAATIQYHCHLSYQIAPLSIPQEPYYDLGFQETEALSLSSIPR